MRQWFPKTRSLWRGLSRQVVVAAFVLVVAVVLFFGVKERTKKMELQSEERDQERDIVQLGKEIFYGQGRCGICHTLGVLHVGKCPSLYGAGSRLTPEFIYESMTDPSAYVKLDFDQAEPKFYHAQMPSVNLAPIGLTEKDMQNVIAFIGTQKVVEGGVATLLGR
jgi:mono/diheme cytochrome c family protein